MREPPVCFFIPRDSQPPNGLPSTIDDLWPWMVTLNDLQRGTAGRFNWTLQTYLYLKTAGFNCDVVDALPTRGIVIAHRDFLPNDLRPGRELLFVCLLADRAAPEWWFLGPHPYAQIHVVQNPRDPLLIRSDELWKSYYVPHWPQPGLLPRDPARGDRFENVAFLGSELAWELKTAEWQSCLKELGLEWHIRPFERWHDYRDIDAIVAIRSFDGNNYDYKPASKLYNAWHGGVPAVLGPEAAYRSERQSEFDYLEAASVHEVLIALQRLRDDIGLRHAMIGNGALRARETTPGRITDLWRSFLCRAVLPAHQSWCGMPVSARYRFLGRRLLARGQRDAFVLWREMTRRLSSNSRLVRGFIGERRRRLKKYLFGKMRPSA